MGKHNYRVVFSFMCENKMLEIDIMTLLPRLIQVCP